VSPAVLALLATATVTLAHGAAIAGLVSVTLVPNPAKRLLRANRQPSPPKAVACTLPDGSAAWWINNPNQSATVVVCHGRSRSKNWMKPLLESLGAHFSVLAFDFAGHGESGFGITSNGAAESHTVDTALRWLQDTQGVRDAVVYGCSMGGAAAILSQTRDPHPIVRGIVTDGTFAELHNVFDRITSKVGVPNYVDHAARDIAGRIAGYRIEDVRPVDVVGLLTVPALFLHGVRDKLVPAEAALRLEKASAGYGRALFYEGGHDEPQNKMMQALVLDFSRQRLIGVGAASIVHTQPEARDDHT
jgi:pimeloyl-ACP methyl ester carboxylesterase